MNANTAIAASLQSQLLGVLEQARNQRMSLGELIQIAETVSYTHLTLPTNREV